METIKAIDKKLGVFRIELIELLRPEFNAPPEAVRRSLGTIVERLPVELEERLKG